MFKRSLLFTLALGMLPFQAAFAEGKLPFEIFNRLRIEYDDNIRQETTDEDDSLKIIEEIEFIVNSQQNNTFIGLRYSPSFVFWDDREEDETDLHHQLDLSLNQDFSERLSVSLKEVFRLSELPELIENGEVTREKNDYIYNSINGRAGFKLSDSVVLAGSARHVLLEYDEPAVAAVSDYDKLVFGADALVSLNPQTQAGAEVRLSQIEYDNDARNSDSLQVGGTFNQVVSPQLQYNVRAGFETKEFDSDSFEDTDSPYVSGAVVLTPSDVLQFNVGGSFSLADSSFSRFANQERTAVFGGATVKVSPRVTANLGVSYAVSDYDGGEAVAAAAAGAADSGDEGVVRLSAQAIY